MRKALSVFLAATCALSLTACGQSSKPAETTAAAKTEAAAATTAAETKAAETEVAAAPAWTPSGEVKFIVCSSAGGGSDITPER